jgi:hypothetical protein
MQFSPLPLLALLTLTTAAPLPDNTSSTPSNALSNGINANLNAGNQEIQSVQTLQSSESNNAPASQVQSNIASLQGALNTAVSDREGNQALAAAQRRAPADAALTAGLDKVASAQANAQGAIGSLNGGAGDAATLNSLAGTFQKGFETNENNLALVRMLFVERMGSVLILFRPRLVIRSDELGRMSHWLRMNSANIEN